MNTTDSARIESLRNLGPVSAVWLRAAGITTIGELGRLGSVVAYRLVKIRQPKASLNLLWALEAGLADIDWRQLTEERKTGLLAELADE
jgi:DNA transformation protein and related proteins